MGISQDGVADQSQPSTKLSIIIAASAISGFVLVLVLVTVLVCWRYKRTHARPSTYQPELAAKRKSLWSLTSGDPDTPSRQTMLPRPSLTAPSRPPSAASVHFAPTTNGRSSPSEKRRPGSNSSIASTSPPGTPDMRRSGTITPPIPLLPPPPGADGSPHVPPQYRLHDRRISFMQTPIEPQLSQSGPGDRSSVYSQSSRLSNTPRIPSGLRLAASSQNLQSLVESVSHTSRDSQPPPSHQSAPDPSESSVPSTRPSEVGRAY